MKQLPFILVLVLSSGLLLWNFRRYDSVHAAERARMAGERSAQTAAGAPADPLSGSGPGLEAARPAQLPGRELLSATGSRVALAATRPMPDAEVFEGPALPPQEEPEIDLADAEIEQVVIRSPGGHVRAEGTTIEGLKHGRWVEWWGPDQLLSEGSYELGKRQGNWTYWYENGEVKEQGAYENDLPDGPWSWNYADGALRLALTYSAGRSDGTLREWAPDGSTLREGAFVDGEPDGRWVESHPDGSPRSETHYLNGLRHGLHRAWYTGGQLKEQGEYRSGLREGRWVFYDSLGRADELRTGYYELGRRHRP